MKRWRPRTAKYWMVNSKGNVSFSVGFAKHTESRYKFGNVFKTKKLAEEAQKRMKRVLMRLQEGQQ